MKENYKVGGNMIITTIGDEIGTTLNQKIQEIFDLEKLYSEVKSSYDILYKELNIQRTVKFTIVIAIVLIALLAINILNFVELVRGRSLNP